MERIRLGDKEKKVLVIDMETEDEMKSRGEEINPDDAIVMIPRAPPPPSVSTELYVHKYFTSSTTCVFRNNSMVKNYSIIIIVFHAWSHKQEQ